MLGGFGFGLALAPVNAALLASTDDDVHGLASALVVVARMVGMLVGISALTTIGLRRYYAEQADLPDRARGVRRQEPVRGVHRLLLKEAGIAQEHDGLPRRRGLRGRRRRARAGAVPRRRHPRSRDRRPAPLGRLTFR